MGEGSRTLRIAPVMTGGTSLAVWMGGATVELYRVVKARDTTSGRSTDESPLDDAGLGIYRRLLELTDTDVEVDVLTGTSAGGLNAALLAVAVHNDTPIEEFLEIRRTWQDTGDLGRLLRSPREADPPSMLRGDVFRDEVQRVFDRLAASGRRSTERPRATSSGTTSEPGAAGGPRSGPVGRDGVDLVVTVTTVEPVDVLRFDSTGTAVHELAHAQQLRFAGDQFDRTGWSHRLAIAARTSAGIPGVFEPSFLGIGEDPDFSDHATFRQSRWAVDGGVVVNLPLTEALDRIYERSADEEVRRIALFITPTPRGEPLEAETDRSQIPTIREAVTTIVSAPRAEGISTDIDRIEDNNRRVRSQSELRAVLGTLAGGGDLSAERFEQYRTGRARRSLQRLIDRWIGFDPERRGEENRDELVSELLPVRRDLQPRSPEVLESTGFAETNSGGSVTDASTSASSASDGADTDASDPDGSGGHGAVPDGVQGVWPWGIQPVEHMVASAIGLLSRTVDVIDRSDDAVRGPRERILTAKSHLHRVRQRIAAIRSIERRYWGERIAEPRADLAADTLRSWYETWPFRDDAEVTAARDDLDCLTEPDPDPDSGSAGGPVSDSAGVLVADSRAGGVPPAEPQRGDPIRVAQVDAPEARAFVFAELRRAFDEVGRIVDDVRPDLDAALRRAGVDPGFDPDRRGEDGGEADSEPRAGGLAGGERGVRTAGRAGPDGDRRRFRALQIRDELQALTASGVGEGASNEISKRLLRMHFQQVLLLGEVIEREQHVDLVVLSSDAYNGLDGIRRGSEKLAGPEMARLGAFLKPSWRANDWLWGRLDAVHRLVLLLLEPDELRRCDPGGDRLRRFVGEVADGLPAEIRPNLDMIHAEITALHRGAELHGLPRTAEFLAGVIQRSIVCEELPRVAYAVADSERRGGALADGGLFVQTVAELQRATTSSTAAASNEVAVGSGGIVTPGRTPRRFRDRPTRLPLTETPIDVHTVNDRALKRAFSLMRISDERVSDELGHGMAAETVSTAASVAINGLTGSKSGLPALPLLAPVRGALQGVAAVARRLVRTDPASRVIGTFILAAAATIVALSLSVSAVPKGFTSIAVITLAVVFAWSLLREGRRPLVILYLLGGLIIGTTLLGPDLAKMVYDQPLAERSFDVGSDIVIEVTEPGEIERSGSVLTGSEPVAKGTELAITGAEVTIRSIAVQDEVAGWKQWMFLHRPSAFVAMVGVYALWRLARNLWRRQVANAIGSVVLYVFSVASPWIAEPVLTGAPGSNAVKEWLITTATHARSIRFLVILGVLGFGAWLLTYGSRTALGRWLRHRRDVRRLVQAEARERRHEAAEA